MSQRLSALLIVLMLSLSAMPAFARTDFNVDIGVAPPAERVEAVPAARPGYTWVPGYWAWEDNQHVWVNGRWMEDRPGYHWEGEHWVHHDNKYRFERGYWARG